MSNGLFFTGVVYKRTRDFYAEAEARQRLDMDKDKLAMQKEELAMRRAENRRKNAPEYKDFGKSNTGDLDFYIRGKKDEYIDWVGNNYDGDTNLYHSGKAQYESDISADSELLSKINSDYTTNMGDLKEGGNTLDQANYVKDNDGVYEWQKRYEAGKVGLQDGTLTPQEFADMYFDNADGSLFKERQKPDIGKGLVDGYKGPKDSYLYDDKSGNMEYYGWSKDAKNAVYTQYMDVLEQDEDGSFINQEGTDEYFNSTLFDEDQGEEVNAMVLFFRDKNDGLTPSEKELSRLNPIDNQFENYDSTLAAEYKQWLSKEKTDPYMVDKGFENKPQGAKDDPFKDAFGIIDWERMSSSQNFTENEYGTHGRMLTDFNFTQNVGGEHDLQASTFNNMEISSDADITTDVAKDYVSEQLRLSNGKIKSKLSQVAISEDHTNMYGIYSIPVSNEATGGKGAMVLEISVPIDNVDSKLLGPVPKRWYNSLAINRKGAYNQEGSDTPKGVGAKYN